MMIRGTTVTVKRPVGFERDEFGNMNPTGYQYDTVANVLIAPGATLDLEASRPEGVSVEYTLHFPKSYTEPLEGCTVFLPEPFANESGYRVVGSPKPYMLENTPGKWATPVEVAVAYG